MKDTNRIDHFVWVVHEENLDQYVKKFSDLFQTTFEEFDGKNGARIFVSWETGFEFATPTGDGLGGHGLKAHLDAHGEGPFAIVFRVPDIEAASERAKELDWPVSSSVLGNDESDLVWTAVSRVREQFVGPFLGTMLLFGQIDYRDGSSA
jgi:hypothetical protein